MAVMYSFCRYLSVRLGTILVAISSMIQSMILTGMFLVWLHNVQDTCEDFENWSSSKKLIYVTSLVQNIQDYTAVYLEWAIVFLMVHLSTCMLLIYAAIKCIAPLVWPFLVLEFLRLALISFCHFTAMMLIKENVLDLGVLIALSLSGGFLLLGLFYNYFCVVSLCQCLQELRQESTSQRKVVKEPPRLPSTVNLLASDFRHLTKTAVEFYPPISSIRGLKAVQSLRNRDYHYGNMAAPTN